MTGRPDMDGMDGRERKWGEALRVQGGEPSPTVGEWAARRRVLAEAVARDRADRAAPRRLRIWIPAAAAAAFLAVWGIRLRDARPPAGAVPAEPPVVAAVAPAPEVLAGTIARAGALASGILAAVDGSVPLAGRLAEEAGRRWIADPLKGSAERVVDAVRSDARGIVRDLVAWTGETRSF